jgi:iron complex outermembrane receptor protein
MARLYRSALFFTTALSLSLATPIVALAAEGDGQPAAAQPDRSAEVQAPEQVIVTATRKEERLQEVPISITVISQQQLSNYNVVNAQDLAATTPSLSVSTNFGSQNSSFAIRGFEQDIGTAPTVGVFFDDVVAPRGLAQGTPAGDGAGPGDFFDLQNVQVLKGPQGTLFGRNTTGGDILLVPQKPTDELGGYVEGTFGNFGQKGGEAVLNIPVNDDLRLRFGIDHQSRDGYVNNTSGISPSNFDDVDFTSLRASADWDVTSNIDNYTVFSYGESDTNSDVQKLIACNPAAGTLFTELGVCNQLKTQGSGFYDAAENLLNPSSKLTQWRVINTTTWWVSDNLTIKNIASFAELNDKENSPQFGTNFSTPAIPGVLPSLPFGFSAVTTAPGASTANSGTYTEELQLQGKFWGDRLTWQGGAYLDATIPLGLAGDQTAVLASCTNVAKLQCTDPIGDLLFLEGAVPFGTPIGTVNHTVGTTSANDYATYFQSTYKLTDELKVTGGIRYTEDREANTSSQITYDLGYPGAPIKATPTCTNFAASLPNCTLSFLEHSHAPTWLLDLDYTPTDNVLAYAKYSRGYRSGVIAPNVDAPFNFAGPERVDAYEVGVKTSFQAPVSGTFDVAGFYDDFAHQQLLLGLDANPCFTLVNGICIPAPVSPTTAPVNAGRSRIDGAEVDATLVPYKGLTLRLGYTYLDTSILQINQFTAGPGSPYLVVGSQKPGDPLPLSPHNKISLSANYLLPLEEAVGKISVGATFTHTDSQLTNYVDLAVPFFASLSNIQPTNLLDLSLNWDRVFNKPIDLTLFATNVTGDKYFSFVPGVAAGTGFETASLGAPTFYGLRVRVRFGAS